METKLKQIAKTVCKVRNVDFLLFHVKTRRKDIVMASHIYCFIAKQSNLFTLEQISQYLNKTHSTVIFSNKTILNDLKNDRLLKFHIQKIIKILELDIDIENLINLNKNNNYQYKQLKNFLLDYMEYYNFGQAQTVKLYKKAQELSKQLKTIGN